MSPIRKLLLVGVGVFALYGLQACASDTELNPQPLPPQDPQRAGDPGTGANKNGDNTGGGATPGAASETPADAGADRDASDAGAPDAAAD